MEAGLPLQSIEIGWKFRFSEERLQEGNFQIEKRRS